jgi:hypothetical protein
MCFVHRFPAGTALRRHGDRVTCTFLPVSGELVTVHIDGDTRVARAPDGVAFSRVAITCESDTSVLCVPDAAVLRLQRRRGDAGLPALFEQRTPEEMRALQILR